MISMSEEDFPILQPLESQMRCCMFSNAKGDIMIVHEDPLDGGIEWVEFHVKTGAMNLVHEGGRIQPLGVALDDDATKNLSNGQQVTLVHFDANKVLTSHQTKVMIVHED